MTSTAAILSTTPKFNLKGKTLASGWKLTERLKASAGSSGGNFGVGYLAHRGNEIAFIKAIDFVDALEAADPLKALSELTAIANFEKDVLSYCADRGMTKVMHFIGHEYISGDGSGNPMNTVSCLIMEAGAEDLRRLAVAVGVAPCAWNLQVIKDVSLGLAQLHAGGIAHLDLKPSNVISIREVNGDPDGEASVVAAPSMLAKDFKAMKVADLGRVVRKNQSGPFDGYAWPGDTRYQPPERWYAYVPADWNDAREAADAYMLASLIVFLFTGTTLQALVMQKMATPFLPENWTGKFDQDVQAVLADAHARVLHDQVKPLFMKEIADDMVNILNGLTHVDPIKRGDARARRQIGKPVGMDRIHQRFSAIAAKAAAIERGRPAA